MREILFRGKAINRKKGYHRTKYKNGEWVYGLVTNLYDELFENIPAEMKNTNGISGIEVDYKTIGQYTGLTDRNGKKIFEGDIVKITDRNVCFDTMAVIEFGNPNGLYTWGWQLKPLESKPFAVEILHWVDMEDSGAFIEVIGNIHDNPELLEVQDSDR